MSKLLSRRSGLTQKAAPVVFRLRDFEIEEVSIVDRPANKRTFVIRKKQEDSMSGNMNKTRVADALSVTKNTLTEVAAIAKEFEGDVAPARAIEIQAKVLELAKSIEGLGEKYPHSKFVDADNLVISTETVVTPATMVKMAASKIVEIVTPMVKSFEAAEEIANDEFDKLAKSIGTVSNWMKLAGEQKFEAPAADPTTTAKSAEPATEPKVEPTVTTEPPKAEPTVTTTKASPADLAAIAENISKALEALGEKADKGVVGSVSKMCDDLYIRGGLSLDTSDMDMLRKIVTLLAGAVNGDDVAKSATATKMIKSFAGDMKVLRDGLITAQTVEAPLLKRASTIRTVIDVLSALLPEKVEAPAEPAKVEPSVGSIETLVKNAVTAAVSPLESKISKLAEENGQLREELAKRNAEPVATRTSTPEPATVSKGHGDATIFPYNYNA